MTLPFAFVFIGAFIIVAIILIVRKSMGKKEVKETRSRQSLQQGPVDTSEMDEKAKKPLEDIKTNKPGHNTPDEPK
jgi:hypothetical protein